MKFIRKGEKRAIYGFAAVFLLAATTISFLSPTKADAAQITSRSIQMSSGLNGATAVTYSVTYTPGGTTSTAGIVVDFCDDTPIIGDTSCTYPAGFSLSAAPTVTFTSGITTTGWTATPSQAGAGGGSYQVLKLSNSGSPTVAGTAINFTIAGITNPTSDNHSFYARVVTFGASADMANYTTSGTTRAATFAGMTDYGGIALSTGKVINITARVMESLAFCVYNATCGDDPSMTLGHGTNMVLDSTAVDTDTANFSISTNAQTGADVRLKGATLTSGANNIDAAGASAVTLVAGTEAFGVRVSTSGTSITADAPYNGGSGTQYAFDVSSTPNVTSLYGDEIADLSGPVNTSVSTLTFAATASNTTAAGIYTGAQQLIATGRF